MSSATTTTTTVGNKAANNQNKVENGINWNETIKIFF